ncbi:MAG: hypothetical protein A3G04_02695 [Candidatus Taylorbacteria bacterium RIFCSPLOWO2_12_FULL_44_9]|nr:MAG: hypothetical protein A3G04_02695 [Candidatus Taylorbacteria bacterium RIFCSPLOWO2_12_FULL_44_9]
METEEKIEIEEINSEKTGQNYALPASILISGIIVVGALIYTSPGYKNQAAGNENSADAFNEKVLSSEGVILPVAWGDLGAKLVNSGVIDADKMSAMYEQREGFTKEYRDLLLGQDGEKLKITPENSGYLLNLFWALGLASKNPILDSGEMTDPKYGGPENFASTAGWTLAKGDPMAHYSRHRFFDLTNEQQELVDKMSKQIYRPCCGNSTHFPDCNHGMAMLGLLELMASQGLSEEEMWKAALAVNSYWFPDTYLTIAEYMQNKGTDWKNVLPREVLGVNYSSAEGYAKILSQVEKMREETGGVRGRQGGGCGV